MGMLSSIWKAHKGVATVATIASALFIPFVLAAAGNYGAVHGVAAKVGGFLTSFWNGLVTNPLTHELGIGPGLENMWNGAKYLSKCFGAVAGAAVDPSKTIFDVLDSPLESLSSQLSIAAP